MHSKPLQLAFLALLLNLISYSLADAGAAEVYVDPNVKVTAIESPPGFFVAVGNDNYAFVCGGILSKKWQTVSVNYGVVTVLTESNKTVSKKYQDLSDETQQFLEKEKLSFIENLVGLELFNPRTNSYTFAVGLGPSPAVVNDNEGSYLGSNGATTASNGYNTANKVGNTAGAYVSQTAGAYSQTSPLVRPSSIYRPGPRYENLSDSPLNDTLDGDIYEFDLSINVLTIYSTSVSLRQQRDLSLVFRDEDYFSLGSTYLPNNINRFFLYDNIVFIVYNDGTVVAKPSWLLDYTELEMVVSARAQLKAIEKLRYIEYEANKDSSAIVDFQKPS